jgi:hypothetical protein
MYSMHIYYSTVPIRDIHVYMYYSEWNAGQPFQSRYPFLIDHGLIDSEISDIYIQTHVLISIVFAYSSIDLHDVQTITTRLR